MLGKLFAMAFIAMAVGSIEVSAQANHKNPTRKVEIFNNTRGRSISLIYAVPSSKKSKNITSDDWMPNDTIRAGKSATVSFDDGTGVCLYDIRAIGDSNAWTKREFDVCNYRWWRLDEPE